MQKRYVIALVFISLMAYCGPGERKHNDDSSDLSGSWPAEDPELLWKYRGLGKGYGGPLITDDGIYVNAEEDGDSYTLCLDLDGTFRWRSPNGKEFTGTGFSASYPGTRSVPSCRGKFIYAISGMGHVSCFHKKSGGVIWTADLVMDFSGKPGDFGYSEPPVLDERKVYCFAGGPEHNIIALDRHTGDLLWSTPAKRDSFAYGTPILLNLPERKVLAGTSRNFIHVIDRSDGSLLSAYRLEDIKYGWEHCNSVVFQDGHIYFVAAEEQGQGSIKLRLSEDGTELKEVWRNRSVVNVFEGFVVRGSCLYTTLESKKLVCLDTETGRIRHSLRAESGNILLADRTLIIYGHNGKLQFFGLKDGIPEFRSEMRIRDGSGQHFSFPVVAGDVMYIRRGDALMAYALR